MSGKALIWVGATLDRLRAFPPQARRETGHQLHLVQLGLEPSDWRPLAEVIRRRRAG